MKSDEEDEDEEDEDDDDELELAVALVVWAFRFIPAAPARLWKDTACASKNLTSAARDSPLTLFFNISANNKAKSTDW